MASAVVRGNARSVAYAPLPPPAPGATGVSVVLFYQYAEPAWSQAQLRRLLAEFNRLAAEHSVTGRGRAAVEGLNCTLTTREPAQARAFCEGLRAFDPLFQETDFKISDDEPEHALFKRLTIKHTEELVAYGLGGARAPSLKQNGARHVDADEYHRMMEDPDAVVIDVRNAYETDIGRMVPPEGGAKLIDPKMRNSREFPKWLNSDTAKEQLKGKKVLMYCTGGIRCERASALLHQIEKASDDFSTRGISMVQGGIDRYLKTFPDGGHWRGKNYLFDRREEQTSVAQADMVTKGDARSRQIRPKCACCGDDHDAYKADFKCAVASCAVPVIVCERCARRGKAAIASSLRCPLCLEGHSLHHLPLPDIARQKRRLASLAGEKAGGQAAQRIAKRRRNESRPPSRRVFVGKLPLAVDADAVRAALGVGSKAKTVAKSSCVIEWIVDRQTKLFYGSAYAHFPSAGAAAPVVDRCAVDGARIGARTLRVNYAVDAESPTDAQPPRPPVPVHVSRA